MIWGLLPEEDWHKQFIGHWTPGEAGAAQKLENSSMQVLPAIKERPELSPPDPTLHVFQRICIGVKFTQSLCDA